MPIAHGHKAARIQSLIRQVRLERPRLTFGKAADGGASANGRIVMLNFPCARGGDQLGQRFTSEAGEREINNIGITEKVVKERLYRSQRIGPAKLKQNYPYTARCLRHPLRFPRTGEFTPIWDESQWRNCKMKVKD